MIIEIPNYDRWKLASGCDDEVVVCHCENCDGEIYKGYDMVKAHHHGVFCDKDCFVEYLLENEDWDEMEAQ